MLVATADDVLRVDSRHGDVERAEGLADRSPTCLARDPHVDDRAWCGNDRGVLRSDDAGASWHATGLGEEDVTALAASPTTEDVLWAGTEPSELWRSSDAGESWEPVGGLGDLPSSSEWSFPPKPETHHVRWITCHPLDAGRLYVAIEAGALVSTPDGGRTWADRVPGGPYDTHELTIHPGAPDTLRSAAGDGYFQSTDAGETWSQPSEGLEVSYLRSIAVDPDRPDVLVASAASHAHSAYRAGSSDGRLYRRVGDEPWERIVDGWPQPPSTIAPLLAAGRQAGELWAVDERGVHRSTDGGMTWRQTAPFAETPTRIRAIALVT